MILAFEPEKTFEIPEGVHSARLEEVREVHKTTKEGIAVQIPRRIHDVEAGMDYRSLANYSPACRPSLQ